MRITDDYIFFWKENPFCNFTKCKIKWSDEVSGEEIYFSSSEQMFMWFKAKFFLDDETADKILATTDLKEGVCLLIRTIQKKQRNLEDLLRTMFILLGTENVHIL